MSPLKEEVVSNRTVVKEINKAVPYQRVTVIRSIILQKVHKGETSLSNAFYLLFSGRELLRSRNKKFRKSLPKKDLFQLPRHLASVG